MRYVTLFVLALLLYPSAIVTAGEDVTTIVFAYKPFWHATYAVYHGETPSSDNERPFVLFEGLREGESSSAMRLQRYGCRYLDMEAVEPKGAHIGVSLMKHIDVSPGGRLALFSAGFHRPVPDEEYQRPLMSSDARLNQSGFMLRDSTLRDELLLFPVFELTGMTLREGERWQFNAPPFLLLEGTTELLRKNMLRPEKLPLTQVHSHWKEWKDVNGYRCAVIGFWFEAKADEKLKQGEEDGKVRYEGTSYFAPDIGLPVVTMLRGDGFVTDKAGNRKTIVLRRKAVLVNHEPYREEKAR